MASIKLLIKSKQKGTLSKIYLRFRQGRQIDITVPTQFLMFPEYWNNKSQTFTSRITYSEEFTPLDKDQYEVQYRNLKTYVLNKVNSTTEMDKELLIQLVEEFHNPNALFSKKINLNKYLDLFIADCETGARLTEKSTRFSPASIKTFKDFRSQFNQYQNSTKKKLNYNDINMKFYNDFIRFFNGKNNSPNTIGKHVKLLKYFMRCARDEDMHNNIEINKRKFKVITAASTSIYLTEDEIKKLYNLDLSDNPAVEESRDIFLIGCYTAQRFADYSRIHKDMIHTLENGIRVIELKQQKTNEDVVIPIRPELEILLAKYDYTIPNTYDQKINKGIKEAGKLCEIDEPILIEKYQGGRKVSETVPKYKMIQSHTARRSGCTNMYLAGIPTIDIMKISGHKTEKEFLKYIKVTKKETAQNLGNHPYFSKK